MTDQIDDCPVCRQAGEGQAKEALACGHSLHSACLADYKEASQCSWNDLKCPVCRITQGTIAARADALTQVEPEEIATSDPEEHPEAVHLFHVDDASTYVEDGQPVEDTQLVDALFGGYAPVEPLVPPNSPVESMGSETSEPLVPVEAMGAETQSLEMHVPACYPTNSIMAAFAKATAAAGRPAAPLIAPEAIETSEPSDGDEASSDVDEASKPSDGDGDEASDGHSSTGTLTKTILNKQ